MAQLHVGTITFDCYPYEPRAIRQVEAAASAGHKVDIICLRQPHELRYEVFNGVHVYRVRINRIYGSSMPVMILRWCWFLILALIKITRLHLKHRYDVIHVHNMPDFLVFAAVIPKLLGARIILDIQDVTPELLAAKIQKKGWLKVLVIWLATWEERISITFAHHVVTTGTPFEQILLKRGVPQSKITKILNSADPNIFPADRRCPLPCESSSSDTPPFNVMYHGTLARRNGLDKAIRALAIAQPQVPHLRLHIQGNGDHLATLKELALQLGVSESVVFTDFCPVHELVDFVVQGDIGIIPYGFDGFEEYVLPTKAYEYAWMHRPIIASETFAIRSLFRSESIYLCDPNKPESFAYAIIDLYYHPEKRASMIHNADEDYVPYHWDNMARRYQQLLITLSLEAALHEMQVQEHS